MDGESEVWICGFIVNKLQFSFLSIYFQLAEFFSELLCVYVPIYCLTNRTNPWFTFLQCFVCLFVVFFFIF